MPEGAAALEATLSTPALSDTAFDKPPAATGVETSIETEKLPLSALRAHLVATAPITTLSGKIRTERVVTLSGIYGSLSSVVAAHLFSETAAPCLIVCSEDALERYETDLDTLAGRDAVRNFVDDASLTLAAVVGGEKKIMLTTAFELRKHILPKDVAAKRQLEITESEPVGYDALLTFLEENRFERKDFVEAEGDYAVRGSIIDVYSYGSAEPVRIEFFGDDVDSIRTFDVTTQLSQLKVFETRLVSNLLLTGETDAASLLSYLPPETLVLIDGADTLDYGQPEQGYFETDAIVTALTAFKQVRLLALTKGDIEFGSHSQQKFASHFKRFSEAVWQSAAAGQRVVVAMKSKKEVEQLAEFLAQPDADRAARPSDALPESVPFGNLTLETVDENFYEGFSFAGIALYTESDVFGKLHAHRARRSRTHRRISLRELRQLQIGDFIVHEDYGIGVFAGLEQVDVGSGESKAAQECVLIRYDKGDKLFVNIQNIDRLSKYSAAEGRAPSLTRLGSGKWQQEKERTKKRLKDIARNLIGLYAKRKLSEGIAFDDDTIWQREFEAAFIFDETPDQETAIADMKKDMQAAAPMDRLICGDVGFGKTEVAMRAAFKAATSTRGKQVAVLVPTTILAQQHFNSFKLRFQNFPTRIEVLNRFVSKQEQKKILADVEKGLVDILIGTHRLISKDVKFKDLGLLIIDEEQHFGVGAKEKLREGFPNVDTLTLTATPIPRTLQFSLMGARDLSIISTPPKNRQPIETVVHEFDTEVIRQAIARELHRGGQVFFLHNRVQSIEQMYDLIKKMFPKARIGVGHGQMAPKELETVMIDFIQKELQILVCTTIIESGLDISNANTIIINRADMFGLSDLYQLRGRVGRSNAKAYCYLLTPPLSTLTKDAMQRLAAIEEFTELGSGFNVAMRDLDIRGAGNMLGAEQSGFIYSLGFDLYQKILEEAVLELKSTEFQNIFKESERLKQEAFKPCEVTFFFDALIPSHYIESPTERFVIYERISKAKTVKDLDKLGSELGDRFGKLPDECRDLLAVSRLRILGTERMLGRIEITESRCLFTLPDGDEPAGKAYYISDRFTALMAAMQSDKLKPFNPQFKNEKRLRLELSYSKNLKAQPSEAIRTVDKLLALLD